MHGIDPVILATSVWGHRRGDCQQQGAGKQYRTSNIFKPLLVSHVSLKPFTPPQTPMFHAWLRPIPWVPMKCRLLHLLEATHKCHTLSLRRWMTQHLHRQHRQQRISPMLSVKRSQLLLRNLSRHSRSQRKICKWRNLRERPLDDQQ